MPTITLAKALKLKNRLAGRLAETQQQIAEFNSTLAEQVGRVDVPALIVERDGLRESLIALKTAIIRTNAPIQEPIIRKGELKSLIEHLKTIATMDGIQRHGYQNTEVTYVAVLKKPEIDRQVRQAEKEIDAIQDALDEFNHSARLEVSQRTLDLAS